MSSNDLKSLPLHFGLKCWCIYVCFSPDDQTKNAPKWVQSFCPIHPTAPTVIQPMLNCHFWPSVCCHLKINKCPTWSHAASIHQLSVPIQSKLKIHAVTDIALEDACMQIDLPQTCLLQKWPVDPSVLHCNCDILGSSPNTLCMPSACETCIQKNVLSAQLMWTTHSEWSRFLSSHWNDGIHSITCTHGFSHSK